MDSDAEKLLVMMRSAVSSTVPQKRIGVAFSGGVDSSLVAKLCHDMGYEITLLTVGFADSHDIGFAREVNALYGYAHRILEITHDSFLDVFLRVRRCIGTDDLSWNENSIAFYYVSRLARDLGISTVVTANGIDELFCGYNAYRDAFDGGESKITSLMDQKLENEINMMVAVNSVTSKFDVSIVQPLLCLPFIEFARRIPLAQKITGSGDLIRKHIIRRLALQYGVPPVACTKRKKALQYGSNIHKTLMRLR